MSLAVWDVKKRKIKTDQSVRNATVFCCNINDEVML